MSDFNSFIKAICSDPDDDTSRLVFADWLDDNPETDCPVCEAGYFSDLQIAFDPTKKAYCGRHDPDNKRWACKHCDGSHRAVDPYRTLRAEFIRIQCELARELVPGTDAEAHARSLVFHALYHPESPEVVKWKRFAELQKRELKLFEMSYHWFDSKKDDLYTINTQTGYPRGDRTLIMGGSSAPRETFRASVRRGFIKGLWCSFHTFMIYQPTLVWHPSMTHADCPDTAQPIKEVVLYYPHPDDEEVDFLKKRFSWISFSLEFGEHP